MTKPNPLHAQASPRAKHQARPTQAPAGFATQLRWGKFSVAQFLKAYWQQKPLLIRGLVPAEAVDSGLSDLLGFALSDSVDCRLISHQNDRWTMEHGPLSRLPSLRRRNWTVLLQGMDRQLEQAYRLRMAFNFLPYARIDDVMISVASDGGGVGPHLDAYDVFLVQGLGRRRWRWGYQSDQRFQHDKPLKLLQQFDPQQEAILEPGDALYLPPRWAHDGVALGPCSTWSVGFRAPSRHEFLQHFLLEAAESVSGDDPRFQDRTLVASKQPGRIPSALAEQLQRWAMDFRADKPTVMLALGRFLSEPAANAWFDAPPRNLGTEQWLKAAKRQGIALHPASRMVYDRQRVWINGEQGGSPAPLLRALADQRHLSAAEFKSFLGPTDLNALSNAPRTTPELSKAAGLASECKKSVEIKPLLDSLMTWYSNGWISFFSEKHSQQI